MQKKYAQTHHEKNTSAETARRLEPPKDPGQWRLHSWAQDLNSGTRLVVVWESEDQEPQRSEQPYTALPG